MRNLDEILAEAKGKRFDRLQPHTHETRTAVEQVAEIPQPKAAPSAPKTERRIKVNKRMLAVALVLSIVALGMGVYAINPNSTPSATPCQGLSVTFVSQNSGSAYSYLYHNGFSKSLVLTRMSDEQHNNVQINLPLAAGQSVTPPALVAYISQGYHGNITITTIVQLDGQSLTCVTQAHA